MKTLNGRPRLEQTATAVAAAGPRPEFCLTDLLHDVLVSYATSKRHHRLWEGPPDFVLTQSDIIEFTFG